MQIAAEDNKKVLIVEPTRFGLLLEGDFPHFFESTADFPVKSLKRSSGNSIS